MNDNRKQDPALFLDTVSPQEALPVLRELKTFLMSSGYDACEILPMPGKPQHLPLDAANLIHALKGGHNMFHKSWLSWIYRAMVRRKSPGAVELHRIFHLCREFSRVRAEELFPKGLLAGMLDAGVLSASEDGLQSGVMITPFRGKLYLSDPLRFKGHDEYTYLGRTSSMFSDLLLEAFGGTERRERLLDVGCGCGIIGISLAHKFREVVGTDIVERCLRFARLNAALNGAENCRFGYSDVYSDVTGRFDVIVTNPPCGWIDAEREQPKTFGTGGEDYGSELPGRILAGAYERLTENGTIYTVLTSPIIGGKPYVVQVFERIYRTLGGRITVYPLFEEFNYKRARAYRRHGISKTVRYAAVIRPADRFSLEFCRLDTLRLTSYRLRTLIPRLAAAALARKH